MLQAILTFPVLFIGLYGLGEWIRFRISGDEPIRAGRIGRSLAIGILTHALVMTVLGFTHLLYPLSAAIVTALPFVLFLKVFIRDFKETFQSIGIGGIKLNAIEWVILVILVFLSLLRLFNALAPNISWDATSHHYLVPSMWLKSGSVSDIPSVIFSYYPSLTEVGISGVMALGTDYLANLYGWIYGLAAVLMLIGIPVRFSDSEFSRTGGFFAAFFFFIFPGIGVQTSGGYVDLPLALWVLLSLDLMLELKRNRSTQNLILAGVASGAILATKHLGILLFIGILIILIWVIFRETERGFVPYKNRLKAILIFTGIAICIALPWYIRSIYFTGNPFYPFGIFGLPTPPHPPFTPSSWVRPDYARSLTGFLSYWQYLVMSSTVGDALGRNYPLISVLAFPLIYFIPKLKPLLRLTAILSFLAIPVIYVLFPVETRYHIPFIAPIAMSMGFLAAKMMDETERKGFRYFFFALILLSVVLGYVSGIREMSWISTITSYSGIALAGFILLGWSCHNRFAIHFFLILLLLVSFFTDIRWDMKEAGKRYKVVMNLEAEDAYLLRESPYNYGTIHHINNKMDYRNMKILMLEPRAYRLKADWVSWFGLKEPIVPTTPEENVAIWYRGGFTHILLGDDVALKALIYFNIVHKDGWDIAGATPNELVEYLKLHPEENSVTFKLEDLWLNFAGEEFPGNRARHFKEYWIPRELVKEGFKTEIIDGTTVYFADRLSILENPEKVAQYAFVRDFREMVNSGGLKVVYTDSLTFLFECDYPSYRQTHPDVDLERLGL